MTSKRDYRVEPVLRDGRLADLRVFPGAKAWTLWGRRGPGAEEELLPPAGEGLPVLLGSGLGLALERLLERGGPVAVVDREEPILACTGLRERFRHRPGLLWLDDPDPRVVLAALTRWQLEQGGRPFAAVALPLWLRLEPDYYGALQQALEASRRADFWARARQPRFAGTMPRVLLFRRPYFLMEEIARALDVLGLPWLGLDVGPGPGLRPGFLEELLAAAVEFRPDFALTVNHFGLDREGRMSELLERLGLPLASWFVDNPHLILSRYQGLNRPGTALFTWDRDTVASLSALGFAHVHYLPLATDPARFRPGTGPAPEAWRARVSFVGNSMRRAVDGCLEQLSGHPELLAGYGALAADFAASAETSMEAFLAARAPEAWARSRALPDQESRLAFESLLTWEATRRYRLDCVRRLLPLEPLVAGDEGWRAALGPEQGWRWHPSLDYGRDLPRFYAAAEINFNCTSRQMKGAVNQRVFDVPACGGFLLTDAGPQLAELFEPGRECAVFRESGEIEDCARRWLADEKGREALALRARGRVLAEHTYAHRLGLLIETMRAAFAGTGV